MLIRASLVLALSQIADVEGKVYFEHGWLPYQRRVEFLSVR